MLRVSACGGDFLCLLLGQYWETNENVCSLIPEIYLVTTITIFFFFSFPETTFSEK